MRRSCNARLQNAVCHPSVGSIQHDERSREHYAALRKKGHSHSRALRGVAYRYSRFSRRCSGLVRTMIRLCVRRYIPQ